MIRMMIVLTMMRAGVEHDFIQCVVCCILCTCASSAKLLYYCPVFLYYQHVGSTSTDVLSLSHMCQHILACTSMYQQVLAGTSRSQQVQAGACSASMATLHFALSRLRQKTSGNQSFHFLPSSSNIFRFFLFRAFIIVSIRRKKMDNTNEKKGNSQRQDKGN